MLKEVLKSVKRVKIEAILSIIFVILECIFEIIIPYVMAKLIDNGINNGNFDVIKENGMIICALIILQVSSGVLCAKYAIKASTVFAYDLRERVFSKIQEFAFSNIDKFSNGSLISRTTIDVNYIQRAFQLLIRGAVRGLGMLVFSLTLIYKIDFTIALLLTVMVPIIVGAFIFISKLAFPVFTKMFGAYDKLNSIIEEDIRGIRVVKSFNREDYEFGRMKNASDSIYNFSVKAERYIALWDPIMNISMYVGIILIAWFGSLAIIASGNNELLGLTTGKLMSLITYSLQMLISLMMISMVYVMLLISSASLKRINEVLCEKCDIINNDNRVYSFDNHDIVFKDVSFKYNKNSSKYVLRNINLEIRNGETIGIIGGTGSGKSTLVNLIPRLYDVTEGEILIGGINVKNYDIDTLRKNIGIVLQKSVLFSGTIASNLRMGDENAKEESMRKVCEISGAMEFIEKLNDGFNSVVEQGGNNFSGGQKQRLSIARTLLKKPKIIIFDDSTSAVDTKTDAKIREALRSKLPNTTKIIISQRIVSLVNCDKIIVLDRGEIVGFDTNDNLLKNCDIYRDIYNLQNSK